MRAKRQSVLGFKLSRLGFKNWGLFYGFVLVWGLGSMAESLLWFRVWVLGAICGGSGSWNYAFVLPEANVTDEVHASDLRMAPNIVLAGW